MAETKDKKNEGAPAGEKKTEKSAKSPAEHNKRSEKESRWDLDACMKAASRFDSVQAWAEGFPSSYKAAEARGFMAECTKHMGATQLKSAKKPAAPAKKSVGGGKKLPKSA